MRTSSLAFIGLAVSLLATTASAQSVSVGARAGTLGPGIEVSAAISSHFNLRGTANYLNYSRSDEIRDFDIRLMADSDVRLASFGLMADILPFKDVLRLSAGFFWNENQYHALVTPLEGYSIEGKTFSPERIGTMEATLGHRRMVQPYFGLGLGNPTSGRLTFLFDIGMLHTDSPQVEMIGTGMIAPTANQAGDLEAGLYSFRWYPVAAVGFSISF